MALIASSADPYDNGPQFLAARWSVCPILNRNLSPLPQLFNRFRHVRRTVSLSVVRDLKCGFMVPSGPKDTHISGCHARRAFSSYSSLDLEPFGSRTLIVANSLTKTHPECCNFRICSLVSSLPIRMKFHLMAFLPHARSPIAPTVFRLLCHTPTQSLTSWCSMDRRLGFPTSRSGLVRSLVHLEGPSRHFIRK